MKRGERQPHWGDMPVNKLLQWLSITKNETKRPILELVHELSAKSELEGSLWRHKKGGEYRIICVAYREQSMEMEVVYKDTQQPVTYIRPLDEFMDGRFTRKG